MRHRYVKLLKSWHLCEHGLKSSVGLLEGVRNSLFFFFGWNRCLRCSDGCAVIHGIGSVLCFHLYTEYAYCKPICFYLYTHLGSYA